MTTTTTVVCPVPGHNHSKDQLKIYHGRSIEPLLACGYHHQRFGLHGLLEYIKEVS